MIGTRRFLLMCNLLPFGFNERKIYHSPGKHKNQVVNICSLYFHYYYHHLFIIIIIEQIEHQRKKKLVLFMFGQHAINTRFHIPFNFYLYKFLFFLFIIIIIFQVYNLLEKGRSVREKTHCVDKWKTFSQGFVSLSLFMFESFSFRLSHNSWWQLIH